MSRSTVRAVACAVGVVVALAACQPVDEIDDLGEPNDAGQAPGDGDLRGAPATGVPATLTESLTRADAEAARWQEGARLAEAALELDEGGRVARASLTYLAADADRLLVVTVTPDGLREEQPTLAGFDLTPITGDALAGLPPLPDGFREPPALVEASQEAFATCGVGGTPAALLYASGAPLAWNPDTGDWAATLGWTATLTSGDGDGAVVDPVSGEVVDCVGQAG